MRTWHVAIVGVLCGAVFGAAAGLLARGDTHGLLVYLVALGVCALWLLLWVRVLVWLRKRGPAWME